MKVMKFITALWLMLLPFLMGACDLFPEDCGARGYLKATISEHGAAPSTTEVIQVRYYDNYSGEEHTEKMGEPDYFAADNQFLSKIQIGDYRFLAYSKFNNKVRNEVDISTIEIYADTVMSAKYSLPVIANTQRLVYVASDNGMILPEDTTYRVFTLTPMVQKIVINIILKGLSVEHKITSLEAMLSGVITGRKIYTNQPLPEYSGLIYNFRPTEEDNKFTSEAYVFGVSNAVPNTLKIECLGETFKQYSSVDLSTVLKDFTADGMVIDLIVEIGENMDMNGAYIDKWQDMQQSDIIFGDNSNNNK